MGDGVIGVEIWRGKVVIAAGDQDFELGSHVHGQTRRISAVLRYPLPSCLNGYGFTLAR
jgi:hypothetical protein